MTSTQQVLLWGGIGTTSHLSPICLSELTGIRLVSIRTNMFQTIVVTMHPSQGGNAKK